MNTMTLIRCATLTGASLLASAAWSQEILVAPPPLPAEGPAGPFQVKILSEAMVSGKTITGAPYSADEKTQTTQTLPDGNRIITSATSKVYRDGQGRTRVEHNADGSSQAPKSIMIHDPVAGTSYVLQSDSHTASKMVQRMSGESASPSPARAARMDELKRMAEQRLVAVNTGVAADRGFAAGSVTAVRTSPMAQAEQNAKVEDLGSQNMEGLAVTGTRHTITIPANAIGNEREINIVDERWYSPELQMTVMSRHNDPRVGETVFTVTNVNRANPDSSLFTVPADYQTTEQGNKAFYFRTQDVVKQP